MTKAQKAERADAIERLRGIVKPGDTIHTILRHVSRSGMSRRISPLLIGRDNDATFHLGNLAARALGLRADDHDVTVGGCGMDMGFHLVYELSARLYPDGFGCVGEGCPSNDHSNGDRDYTRHGEARVCPHCDLTKGEPYRGPCTTCPRCVKPTEGRSAAFEHWHRNGGDALRQRWL